MMKMSFSQKLAIITGIILMVAIAVLGVIFNKNLGIIIPLSVIQFVLIQAICYIGIYSKMKVGTARGRKLFTWGMVTTLIFSIIIILFAADNFRTYAPAIIALLGYASALIMREVENTNPANKKEQRQEK
ncbi:hypothetical protein [Listeria ilorinensis]|uniref:hypothetical protein n=1 Tax=Listeria ilorinensis TaxID=2867439 RepID=UPI001EF5ABA0|nr:hypothetical protein [Listeria ilorinensis]